MLLIRSNRVQNIIISHITEAVAEETHADLSVAKVRISWSRKVVLEDVYLSDQTHDTLIYISEFEAKIDSIKPFKQRLHIKNVKLHQPIVNIRKTDSLNYNFSFFIDYFGNDTVSSSLNWQILSEGFFINDGYFSYFDSSSGNAIHHASDVNIDVDEFSYNKNNELILNIKNVSFEYDNNLTLDNLSSNIVLADSVLSITDFNARTKYSALAVSDLTVYLKNYYRTKSFKTIKYDIDLNLLSLNLKDVAFLLGDEYNKNITANISGVFQGDMVDMRGKKLRASVENFTNFSGDFYLNGIDNIESAYMFVNLNESYANLTEIRNLDLPSSIFSEIEKLPVAFDSLGTIRYRGNFTGFFDDFVTYGTVYSNLGTITGDLSFKPLTGSKLKLNGKVNTKELDVRTIFNNQKLNKLTLNGEVNGILDYATSQYDLQYKGDINKIGFNNYDYTNLSLNGNLKNEQFDGLFSIDDRNLKMTFSGKLDLMSEIPLFVFDANVEKANLCNLYLSNDDSSSISMNISANIQGSNIDSIEGTLFLTDINYANKIDSFYLDNVLLQNKNEADSTIFTIKSDVLEGTLFGKYSLSNIVPSLVSFYQNYLPSSYYSKQYPQNYSDALTYQIKVKDINPVVNVFAPNLVIEPDFYINGSYQSALRQLYLNTEIKYLRFNNREIEHLSINVNSDSLKLYSDVKCQRLNMGGNLQVYNVDVDASGTNDSLYWNLSWDNLKKKKYSGSIGGAVAFFKTDNYPHINIGITPSEVFLNDSLWSFDQCNISIDSSAVDIDNLNFHHNTQRILIDGKVAQNNYDEIYAKIENVNFSILAPLLGNSYFDGKINGDVKIADFYRKMMLNLKLAINNFTFEEGYVGELLFSSNWNNEHATLATNIDLVKGKTKLVEGFGEINPQKSQLDIDLSFEDTPLTLLQVFMPSTFNNQTGYVDGKVRVYGGFKHIMHDGVLIPDGPAQIGLTYLNTVYTLTDPIYLAKDSFMFKNITFYDKDGNSGLLNGYITHHTFSKMIYNMNIVTNRLLALNTSEYDNDAFYGTAYVSGSIDITGKGLDIILSGDARSERGTTINIPYESGENAKQYDFIDFVNNKEEVQEDEEFKYDVVTSGMAMNFDIDLTPDAKVQLIFNSQLGDVIKGTGSGSLQVKVDKYYNINIYGTYEIEEGEYLFTLENIMNKHFSIKQGGTLQWAGNPYDAVIDINAVYKVKTTLYNLFAGSTEEFDLTRRIPVDCKIHLTDNLTAPKVDFSIDLPTVEEYVKDRVEQLIVTPEDVNKQMISLLILGNFYTPEIYAGFVGQKTSTSVTSTASATASEMLSNQLSNWLSQMIDFIDIGFNYHPSNEITDDQIELALSKQAFNDRLSINGNFANNVDQESSNDDMFIGDVDVSLKLTESGRLQLKAYNHYNDYDKSGDYTLGVGFSYREDFNSLKELFTHYKEVIFRKKKKKKDVEKE